MKRIMGVVVVALLLATGSRAAAAEESTVEVKAGIKAWMNQWKRDTPGAESKKSKDSYLVGAFIEGVENNVFMEAAYAVSMPDYKISEAGGDTTISRADLDLAVGYELGKYFGIFVGYRNSEFKEKDTSAKETSSGPLAGLRANVPIAASFYLSGQASYLFTRLKTDAGTESAPGWVGELGLTYDFSKQLAGSIGYKYETTKGKNTSVKDTFSGLTAGVTYLFE